MSEKKIFTSYYGCRELNREKHFLVKISNGCPRAVNVDATLDEAIPDWNTIVVPFKDGRLVESEYRQRYLRILDGRKDAIEKALVAISKRADSRDVVLLCFEAPESFCHRHIFAEWAKANLQLEISELGKNNERTGLLF